jgi:hypothetical protein
MTLDTASNDFIDVVAVMQKEKNVSSLVAVMQKEEKYHL